MKGHVKQQTHNLLSTAKPTKLGESFNTNKNYQHTRQKYCLCPGPWYFFNIPTCRKITYVNIIVDYRPQNTDPNRVRIKVGGNLIEDSYEVTTWTADPIIVKILCNSVVSTPNAKYFVLMWSTHQRSDLNTCKCQSNSSHNHFLQSMTSDAKLTMGLYTWKLERACMDYHRLVS